MKSLNCSHNNAKTFSSVGCDPYISHENGFVSSISFSSFFNNTSTSKYCIEVNNEKCQVNNHHEIRNTNIISNHSPETIFSQGNTDISLSSILGNGNPLFSHTHITIINCSRDNTEKEGSGEVSEIFTTKSFIIALTFYETGECQNLFVQFSNPTKCHTIQSKNIFLHKMILNCFFILIFS